MIVIFLISQQIYSEGGLEPVPEGSTVAVLNFEAIDVEPSLVKTFEESLTTSIIATGKLRVVERSQMDKLLSEARLSLSGMISQEQAKAIGGILGADYLIIGSISRIPGYTRYVLNVRVVKSDTGEAVFATKYEAYSKAQLISLSDRVAGDITGKAPPRTTSEALRLVDEFYSLSTPKSTLCLGLGSATPTIGLFKADGFGFPRFWFGFSLHTLGFSFRWFGGVPKAYQLRLAYREAIKKLGPRVPRSYRVEYVREVYKRRVFPYFELGFDLFFLPTIGLGYAWVPSSHFITHFGVRFGLLHYMTMSGKIDLDEPELARYFLSTLFSFGFTYAF